MRTVRSAWVAVIFLWAVTTLVLHNYMLLPCPVHHHRTTGTYCTRQSVNFKPVTWRGSQWGHCQCSAGLLLPVLMTTSSLPISNWVPVCCSCVTDEGRQCMWCVHCTLTSCLSTCTYYFCFLNICNSGLLSSSSQGQCALCTPWVSLTPQTHTGPSLACIKKLCEIDFASTKRNQKELQRRAKQITSLTCMDIETRQQTFLIDTLASSFRITA